MKNPNTNPQVEQMDQYLREAVAEAILENKKSVSKAYLDHSATGLIRFFNQLFDRSQLEAISREIQNIVSKSA